MSGYLELEGKRALVTGEAIEWWRKQLGEIEAKL